MRICARNSSTGSSKWRNSETTRLTGGLTDLGAAASSARAPSKEPVAPAAAVTKVRLFTMFGRLPV